LLKYIVIDNTSSVSIATGKAPIEDAAAKTPHDSSSVPVIPEFISIDTELGLSFFSGNTRLYLKIIKKFAEGYRNLDVNALDSEQLKRSAHTVRGLSSNIGASKLNAITVKLDADQNEALVAEFSKSLKQVIDEIDEKTATSSQAIETPGV